MDVVTNLVNSKILANANSKAADIFKEIYSDVLEYDISSPHKFISELWSRYEAHESKSNALSGTIYETLLACLFFRTHIKPLYVQARISFVPNVNFDFIGYTKEFGPVILSAKTSLRERYKQADLEGMMVRYVHRNARSYLITSHVEEARNVNTKIKNGEVLGIDRVVVATSPEFDDLIKDLQTLNFYKPPKFDVIRGAHIIE